MDANHRNGSAQRPRPHTDAGNVERFVDQHASQALFVEGVGFHTYDGRRWLCDVDDARVTGFAIETARSIVGDVEQIAASDPKGEKLEEAIRPWARQSEANGRLHAMVELASKQAQLRILADDLDADDFLFNCQNATINLRTGERRPHDPKDRIGKISPVIFDKQAEAPLWQKFLHRIFSKDESLIRFVKRALGLSLTGDRSEEKFFIAHGKGQNGKTTLVETFSFIMGDYATTASRGAFLASKFKDDKIPNDIAKLRGARFVRVAETAAGRRLDVELIKQVTGKDPISARFLNEEWFDFFPKFKPWLSTNSKPVIYDDSNGMWRRLRLIPFEVEIPNVERDNHLDDKLKAEASGILNWLIEGCLEWQREGLGESAAIELATAEYRAEQDRLSEFLDEACVEDKYAVTKAGDLYRAYKVHCGNAGRTPVSTKTFGELLLRKFKKRISNGK